MPLNAHQLRTLRAMFPGDALLTSPEDTFVFGADALRRHAAPWAVVRPENTEQAAALLAFAQAESLPVFPRGRATNVVGGCVPLGGGIVLATSRMNRIIEISPDDFLAVAEPGVVTGDLQEACRAQGLYYAPDPASAKFSSIGGNLAMNAGGMRALKYGSTRDNVLGLTVALPGGTVIHPGGRCHKNVAGLDLVRLFVGSEGTLGFIGRATLKLLPLPEASASLLAVFPSEDAALDAARGVFAAGILPAAMEFMPAEVLAALAALGEVPWPVPGAGAARYGAFPAASAGSGSSSGPASSASPAGAALLLAVDGSAGAVTADLARLDKAVAPHSPLFLTTAKTPADEEVLWESRRQINQAAFTIAPNKLSDDIVVPRGKVGQAIGRIRAIGRELGLTILAFGHLGDGNLHVNVMYDAADPLQATRAPAAKQAVLEAVLALDGSITGEHGVGLSKLDWLPRQTGPLAQSLMHGVKAVFDPAGIMNPGKAY